MLAGGTTITPITVDNFPNSLVNDVLVDIFVDNYIGINKN